MTGDSDPVVSLIMAAWNPEPAWLLAAVESALGQTDCDLELVIVDDGSAEPLERLLADVADPRLSIIRTANWGIARARNEGLRSARGAYVRFVDADDVIEPGSTARLLELAGGAEDVVTYGVTVRCDEELRPIGELRSEASGDALELCLLGKIPARHMSMLFPRALIDRVGEWDDAFSACSDWDFVLRALEHAELRPGDFVATYYRNHPNMTCASLERTEPGMRLVVERYVERHPEARSSHLHRRARANVERGLAYSYLMAGERRRFVRLQLGAGRLAPVDTARATAPIVLRLSRLAVRKARRVWLERLTRLVAPVR